MLDPIGALQLGSLTITNFIIALFLTVIVTFFVLSWWLRREGIGEHEHIMGQVQNGLIIGIITYKLWPFILSPTLLLEPRNLILYAGGPWAIQASLILTVIWFSFHWWKKKWPLLLINTLAGGLFVGLIVYSFLIKEIGQFSFFPIGYKVDGNVFHPVNFYKAITYSAFLFFAFHWINREKKGGIAFFLFISFIITHYLIMPFQF